MKRKWKMWFAAVAVMAMAVMASAAQADEQPRLTATAVQVTASDTGVAYQAYANRYVVGPNGWLEWKITVKEKIAGFAQGSSYDFDKDSVSYWERKRAVVNRQEGDHTLVFRFEPGLSSPSGPLTLDRQLALDGGIRYYATNPGDGQTTIRTASVIDMGGVGGMAVTLFKREYPTLAITPNPDDLRKNNQPANGLSVDRIIVSVNDPVLDPQDFQFKYDFTAGTYRKKIDWTVMAERNTIDVPPEARNKGAHLTIEVRDKGGNWRPYTYFYPGPGGPVQSWAAVDPFNVFGGNVGDSANRYLNMTAGGDNPDLLAYTLQMAKKDFKYLQRRYEAPQNKYTWLAVFVYGSMQKQAAGYTGFADVNLERSGYLWSTSPNLPEDDLPVTPFKRTVPAKETNSLSGRVYEGHWGVISSDETAALGEGTYYLYVKAVDAVTGGYTWQQVYYDADRFLADKNASNFAPVKLVKDITPLAIRYADQPFGRGEYTINATVSDNFRLGAAQYMVSGSDRCLSSPGLCAALGDQWTDAPLAADGKTATIALNTATLKTDQTNVIPVYVYVRAVEYRHTAGTSYESNPFAAGNSANIVAASRGYYIVRGENKLELKMSYVGRVDETNRLAAAPQHRVRLYAHAAGLLASEGDIRYRLETAGGAVVQDWTTVQSGDEIVLAGANGEYKLRAYAAELEGSGRSEELVQPYVIGTAAPSLFTAATFGTTALTNQDVTLALTSSVPVKIAGVDDTYATAHTLSFADNVQTTFTYQQEGGPAETLHVKVGHIDKTGFAYLQGSGTVVYTPSQATTGEVTARLYVGKRVKPGSGDGITYRNGWLSYSFPANGSHVFEAEDLAGNPLRLYLNETSRRADVGWIDSSVPNVSIAYSKAALTNQPVTATLQLPGGLTVVNNGGSPAYTFAANGDFTFIVKDTGGVIREYTATVANIDKEPPVITLQGSLTYPVYQGLPFAFVEPGFAATDNRDGVLTASVQVSNNVDVYKGGYYEIVYTVSDSAGNTARQVRGVSVMDLNGINVFVNQIRLRGDVVVPRGTLQFDIIGQESNDLVFRYLPGRLTAGAFKGGGIPLVGRTVVLNEAGWYTIFIQDRERRTFVGQINVQ
ncbi:MAG: DUF5011 domain-containing protein [Paenibacillaceae bacterium]|nr:DUF5011 domain-containing protein [Paenibacillaceae bacterium]